MAAHFLLMNYSKRMNNPKTNSIKQIYTKKCLGCSNVNIEKILKNKILSKDTIIVYSNSSKEFPNLDVHKINTQSELIISTAAGIKKGNQQLKVIALFQNLTDLIKNTVSIQTESKLVTSIITILANNKNDLVSNSDFNTLVFALTNGFDFIVQETTSSPEQIIFYINKALSIPKFTLLNIIPFCTNPLHKKPPVIRINNQEQLNNYKETLNLINETSKEVIITGEIYRTKNKETRKKPKTDRQKISKNNITHLINSLK